MHQKKKLIWSIVPFLWWFKVDKNALFDGPRPSPEMYATTYFCDGMQETRIFSGLPYNRPKKYI